VSIFHKDDVSVFFVGLTDFIDPLDEFEDGEGPKEIFADVEGGGGAGGDGEVGAHAADHVFYSEYRLLYLFYNAYIIDFWLFSIQFLKLQRKPFLQFTFGQFTCSFEKRL